MCLNKYLTTVTHPARGRHNSCTKGLNDSSCFLPPDGPITKDNFRFCFSNSCLWWLRWIPGNQAAYLLHYYNWVKAHRCLLFKYKQLSSKSVHKRLPVPFLMLCVGGRKHYLLQKHSWGKGCHGQCVCDCVYMWVTG